jgi:hypothetical protein
MTNDPTQTQDSPAESVDTATTDTSKKIRRTVSRKVFAVSLTASLALLLAGGGFLAWSYTNYFGQVDRASAAQTALDAYEAAQSPFPAALKTCDLNASIYAVLGDDDNSLTLDMEGNDEYGRLEYNQVFCVLDKIGLPDSVDAQMGQTRALDGRQTATWDDITASWGYHPDSGLDMILTHD